MKNCEEDRILAVANQIHVMCLDDYEGTILFTKAVRTTEEYSSNAIEINKIEGLRNLASSQGPTFW